MRPMQERLSLVRLAVAKFRRAIRLRPEFDRACYNLGTVYYAYATSLQMDAAARMSAQLTQVGSYLLCAWMFLAHIAHHIRIEKWADKGRIAVPSCQSLP